MLKDFVATKMKYLSLVLNHNILRKASVKKKINLKKHSQNLLIKRLLIENLYILGDNDNKIIDLNEFGLKEKNLKIFLESLYESEFNYFNLSGNCVTNKAMAALIDYLIFNHKIKTLILRSIAMEKTEVNDLCQAICFNKSLTTFHLSGDKFISKKLRNVVNVNKIKDEQQYGIENLIKSPTLENLYLHDFNDDLSEEDFEVIFNRVVNNIINKHNSKLEKELKTRSKILGKGVLNFSKKKKEEKNREKDAPEILTIFKILSLENNRLCSKNNIGCIKSLSTLISHCGLRELNLAKCHLNDSAIGILVDQLKQHFYCKHLRKLNISSNLFFEKGANKLGELIAALCTTYTWERIQTEEGDNNNNKQDNVLSTDRRIDMPTDDFYLFLNDNDFKNNKAIEHICTGFAPNSHLFFHLYLDNTSILDKKSSSSINSLINLLSLTPRIPIKTLSLNNNQINDHAFDALFKGYPAFKPRDIQFETYVSLYNNTISPEVILKVLNGFLPSFHKLRVRVNYFSNTDLDECYLKRVNDMQYYTEMRSSKMTQISEYYVDILSEKKRNSYLDNCFNFLEFYHKKHKSFKKRNKKKNHHN